MCCRHLGGMREEFISAREHGSPCSAPNGPHEHGFEDYVSILDGARSPRYQLLKSAECNLHTAGHRFLIRNDIPAPAVDKPSYYPDNYTVLSDREASEAVDLIETAIRDRPGQPWFVQLWFNAPHSPFTSVRTGMDMYDKLLKEAGKNRSIDQTCPNPHWNSRPFGPMNPLGGSPKRLPMHDSMEFQYKTMVAGMDRSLGYILDYIEKMGIENNTIIIFTSDNGPEKGVGK
jgi:arylsulfatase A-like enzyme